MIIRTAQFERLAAPAEQAFVDCLVDYLRKTYGQIIVRRGSGVSKLADCPDGSLRRMVVQGIVHGRSFGLTWESSLATFVILMFVSAPNFYEHAAVLRCLTDSSVIADLRIDFVTSVITQEVWKDIENGYDPGAWYSAERQF